MKVTVEFIRRGRTVHTKEFEIKSVDLFIKRLNSQFGEYILYVDEVDIADVNSDHYDRCIHGAWYTYTGRMVYCRSVYGGEWRYEYEDENGNATYL